MVFKLPDWPLLVFWIVWSIVQSVIFVIGYFMQKNNPALAYLNDPIGVSILISRGSGLVLWFDAIVIFLPVCRNFLTMLRTSFLKSFVPFDSNLYFHKQVGYSIAFFSVIHTCGHMFNLLALWKINILTPFSILLHHYAGVTGLVLVIVQLLMFTAAHPYIRKKNFEIFQYTHQLAFVWIVAISMHGLGCFVKTKQGVCVGYFTWKYALTGIIIYTLERLLRLYRYSQSTLITKIVEHPGKVIEIQFVKKSMAYKPGQYVFINIPEVSKLEWHPFTLTSAPEEDHISVHIKVAGDWTSKLAKRLGCFEKITRKLVLPKINVDGPFGTPTEDVFQYDTAVMIGAGIGVTPFVSVLKSVWFQLTADGSKKLKKIHFFWICRDRMAFSWFQSILEALEEQVLPGFLQIHIYLTGSLSIEELQFVIVNRDSTVDPTTCLKERTNYGRPHFPTVLNAVSHLILQQESSKIMTQQNLSAKKIGVFFCGPKLLEKTVKESVDGLQRQFKNALTFDFHKEQF